MTIRQLSLAMALCALTLAGLLLIASGCALITGHWEHYEDGSGAIDWQYARIEYCNPVDICAED